MPRRVKIPREFHLLGHCITVEYSPTLVEDHGARGMAYIEQNRIVLQTPNREWSRSVIAQSFYHEAVHFILHYSGQTKLGNNERLVDRVAQLIYQMNVSALH